MRPITFCIATAKNEKDYVSLLLRSLMDNTQYNIHEFLIFVDSDNQNSFEALQEFKKKIPNLKIYRNQDEYPVGGQRNISVMFASATNEVVCYLQSDMVVSENFDIYLNESLKSEDEILCFTRIEPPLHPASPEKIVMDFGLHPTEFAYDEFMKFTKTILEENRPNTLGHFAPFAVFKNTWVNVLGGFDTQFRCSREDSDVIMRLNLNNIKMVQTWKGMVYHFTCVSSRGHEWFKQDKSKESELTANMQVLADREELKRFIRKWGFFGHDPRPVYDISCFVHIDGIVNFNVLKFIEPFCGTLIIDDAHIAEHLRQQCQFDSDYYGNVRWKYSLSHWNKVKYLFNPTDWNTRIQHKSECTITNGAVIKLNYSALQELQSQETRMFFENIHAIVDQYEVGEYQLGGITLNIINKVNKLSSLKKNGNLDLLLTDRQFIFE